MNEAERSQKARELTNAMDEIALDCKIMASQLYCHMCNGQSSVSDPNAWPVIGRLLDYATELAAKTKELQDLLNP